ncbi:MAG: hTAFII28-like protein conserved region-domain-containing protein [Monoraphidium minutum]|nr:MAG: hTAFII28-like protein conserved region-domain-containing protein [Monoraphidium minutum]
MQIVDEEHTTLVRNVMSSMDEAQYERFVAFNNARLNSRSLKKLVSTLTRSDKVDPLLLLALGSVTKAFLGELVEQARILAARQGHRGALLPSHIRQAYARLELDGRTPHRRAQRKPLLR